MESLISNQFRIRRAASTFSCDDAFAHGEVIGRHAKLSRSDIQESFARGGCGLAKILRVEVGRRRLASRSGALVRRDRSVALNQLYAPEWDAEFFCDELGLCSEHTLSKVALSRVSLHGSVGRHCDP